MGRKYGVMSSARRVCSNPLDRLSIMALANERLVEYGRGSNSGRLGFFTPSGLSSFGVVKSLLCADPQRLTPSTLGDV